MKPRIRQELIVDYVRQHEKVTVDALAAAFEASRETIRRDLTDLAHRGLIKKFHGGAALPEIMVFDGRGENPFLVRMQENLREKRAIARRAAALFQPGDTILIDTGTTTVVFADELCRLSGLTVITNSVHVAQAMTRASDQNTAFLIGGKYRDESGENLGAMTVEEIGRFHAKYAVLTVGAIEEAGFMDYDMEEAEIARTMIAQSRHITVLADSSKLTRTGLFQVCPLGKVDRLVTDRMPTGNVADALARAGVEIIIAPPTSG
ncbi:DeoR/GlpR transcriptional regulator [Phreatobacter stygius]|uniref:DeoR/GlpR transcriptional regulator n=2 Tax=Phreatobacter stygius TaxID=1940610 RepID=A0A4D7BDR6_9HYPH|nr:DeoR/GlpR transcriptional regulator [Phreatobacter stygius]